MKEISKEGVRVIQIEILKYVHEFCTANDIEYFLCYGSLIGAVRHKGFIPWDDDIDIAMTRENYDKIISLFNKKSEDSAYRLTSPEVSRDCMYSIVNIYDTRTKLGKIHTFKNKFDLGVRIDLVAIDSVPDDDDAERKKLFKKTNDYFGCVRLNGLNFQRPNHFNRN